MNRYKGFLAALGRDPGWSNVEERMSGKAYYPAALHFAKHYQGTSVMHRFIEALRFADKAFKNEQAFTDSHRYFILYAVVKSTVDDWANRSRSPSRSPTEPMAADFTRIILDLFMVYHVYFTLYKKTLRGASTIEEEWQTMLERFKKLTPLDRACMFEELVSYTISDHEDWLLRQLAPFLELPENERVMVSHISQQPGREKILGRKVWDSIADAAITHATNLTTRAVA